MKKKKVINNIFYFLLGGIVLGGFGVFAATSLQSNSILYDTSTSGGTSTNVR